MSELDRLGWVVTDWFDIQGDPVGVRTTSHAFSGWIRHTLADHAMSRSGLHDDDARYSVVVEDGRGHEGPATQRRYHLLYDGIWNLQRTLDVRALVRGLLNELDARCSPTRGDAIFLQAAVVRLGERTVLAPATLVDPRSSVWRRLGSRMEVGLPEGMTVAVDPGTGRLIRPAPVLQITPDAHAALADAFPLADTADEPPAVDGETVVDTVLMWAADPGPVVRPASRADAVVHYARCVRNAAEMGGASIRGLGALVAGAECLEVGYATSGQAIDVFDAVARGRRYSEDRREVTPAALGAAQAPDLGSDGPDEVRIPDEVTPAVR